MSEMQQLPRISKISLNFVEQLKEICREERGIVWLETLGRDIRHAARMLARSPVFALVAMLALSRSASG